MDEQRMRRREQQTGERVHVATLQNPARGLTVTIMAIMGVALAIDASSEPLLSLLSIVVTSSLIAALIFLG